MSLLKRSVLSLLFISLSISLLIAKEFTIRIAHAGNDVSFAVRKSLNDRYTSFIPLTVKKEELAAIVNEKPSHFTLSLPSGLSLPASITLKTFNVLASDAKFFVVANNGQHETDFAKQWVSYIGSIDGYPRSVVTVTFSRFGMEAMFDLGKTQYFIRAVEGTSSAENQTYLFFNEANAKNITPFRCGIDDTKNNSSRSEAIRSYPGSSNLPEVQNTIESYLSKQSTLGDRMKAGGSTAPAISADTIEVRLAVDGDFPLYLAKNSSTDSVTVLMLSTVVQASAIYLRDLSVSLKISFARVWTVSAPFGATDIFSALRNFQTYWTTQSGGVDRVTAHLFSGKYIGSPGVGGIAYLNSLCDQGYGYGVTTVDTANTGYLLTFAHELGHNFGSYHTHSCLWPNGPIDHCSDIEGGCSSGPNVDTIGTIMSYCSTREMKFHPTTAALMRRVVETSWCALSTSTIAVAQADSVFLNALYTSTGGANWTKKMNWVSAPVNGRFGIAVRTGRVVSIDLPANNLIGQLPAGLTDLTALRRLNLSGRNFYREPAISNRDPSQLVFNQNRINGSIPAAIDQLSALEYLDLSNNLFSGTIPSSIGNLSQLRWLNLSENPNITGPIPTSLGSLQNLELLDLYQLTGLTGGIPVEITTLSQLRALLITRTKSITGAIPSQIGNLSKLYLLHLGDNKLTGSIPASISTMTTLEQLLLEFNQLSGPIPSDIGNLKNLNSLSLNDNQLDGTVPASFSTLTKLGSLNLSRNKFTGTIPATIGDMNLLGLYLSENKFSGSVPIALGKLSSLIEFDISGNTLTGTIPDTLRNLGSSAPGDFGGLIMFNVGNNQFTGAVPAWLAQRTKISQLNLGGNNFTPLGTFPQWILDLPSPVRLYLSNLGITGPIPAALMAKTSLNDLDLSNNQLTGTIPAAIGNLNQLRIVRLSGNQLTGAIPVEMGNIPFLTDVRLSNNQLTDTIPGFFGKYLGMQYLHLSNNKFSGKAPKNIAASSGLREFLISNNDLESLPNPPNGFFVHTDSTARVEVENNKVTFTDVLPYVTSNLKGLKYAPQKPLASPQTFSISATSKVTLTVDVAGTGNAFKWYKNDSLIAGATSSAYEIQSLSSADTGKYSARVTNPGAPLLTLERSPFTVKLNTSNLPGDITLISPRSGSPAPIDGATHLLWNLDPNSLHYYIEIDSAGTFNNWVHKDSSIGGLYTVPAFLNETLYYWHVRGANNQGVGNWSSVWSFIAGGPNSVTQIESPIPTEYRLDQNYPNPFNPSTTISFALPKSGMVRLKIFNVLGQLVETLTDEFVAAGYFSVKFNAGKLSSGIYFYRIEAGEFTATKRLMLVK